ncbi:MAG TPA: S41 family peptidase [Stellaceae bacterium]|nr:S41 family peptidase [Stellaceae bacterium]
MRKLAVVALISTLFVAGGVFAEQKPNNDGVYEELNFFDEAFERVRQDAVDPVTDTKLIGAAISGMLTGLDPRSSFLDAAAFKASQKPANEDQASLGLVVTIENGQLKVISPQDGSPAAKAGVKPGDLIFAIDKEPTYDLTLSEAEQKLRGPAGSEVELTLRRGNGAPMEVKIKREPFKLQTVAAHIDGGNIGYLRIAGFDSGTASALASAVQDLRQKTGNKVIGFILDLRNNPGGGFDAAVATADQLIDKGDIVVVKGRKPASTKRISATPGEIAKNLPIVTLINGGTAREAELVAGALQDNHRAVVLGTKSFGEASIESLIPLGNGGAIRLTTARFTTPSGREIQGKGLQPDLSVGALKLAKFSQGEGRHEADLPGALKNPDDAATPAAKPPGNAPPSATATPAPQEAPSVATGDIGSAEDEQLTQAIDVLRGLALIGRRASG